MLVLQGPANVEHGTLMSGQYDIWVGSYDRGRGIPTQVFFSEVPPR